MGRAVGFLVCRRHSDPDVYAKAKAAGKVQEIPTNQNPRFVPVIHPTLQTGVETLLVSAKAWLSLAASSG